jgi:hypothetical protein
MRAAGSSPWPTTPPRPLVTAWSHNAANRAELGFCNSRSLSFTRGDTASRPSPATSPTTGVTSTVKLGWYNQLVDD